ncbi:MAG: nascent polypeptide-associated complex protein [Candidatus Micrarchaeota archaeon]
MFPNMDKRQMAALMRQFGVKNEEIKANRVVIELQTGRKIIIDNPNVLAIEMQGDKSYQISGTAREVGSKDENAEGERVMEQLTRDEEIEDIGKIAEHDIALVAEQAKVSKEEAMKALDASSGDIAEAILKAGKKSEYLDEVGEQKRLLKFIENSHSRDLKEKAPLLFEKNHNDQLKAVHSLHQLGREQILRLKREEKSEALNLLKTRLERIIESADEGEKTLIKEDLRKKSAELLEWLK